MANLPLPSQVARNHAVIYEGFYQQVDPASTDRVLAMEAASFLKRSALPDKVLSKIWDMADPQGKGFLDKRGFFVALKLIALSQSGKDLAMANLSLDVPPPQLKTISGRSSPAIDWTIKPLEQKKYEEMFYSMSPVNGRLPGDKVRPVMLNSKLPVDVLGRIWDLSDTDQDGFLSKEEFILAMHLIYKALENIPVPSVLPPDLMAILRKRNSSITGVQVLPDILPPAVDASSTLNRIRRSSTPSSDITARSQTWVVNSVEKAKFDELFRKLDTDMDGFVGGADVKDVFLKSGLPQAVLAHIWNLCDIKQNGKLNVEQFALAMYFVQQKLQGLEIPAVLLPEMVPPTLRPKPVADILTDSPLVIPGEPDTTGSKELDLISSEIKELQVEKMALEKDLAQKEADVKIKNGELKNCQNELDALETMLKQLEMQKGEARKRLNDLDNQKSTVDSSLTDVIAEMEDELKQIELLKKQKEEQRESLEAQEEELSKKRQEFSEIKQEEEKLETRITKNKSDLQNLTNKLQTTQLQISQIKLKIDNVKEQYQLMSDGIAKMDAALSSGDCSGVPDFILNGISPLHEADFNAVPPIENEPAVQKEMNGPAVIDSFQEDPFGAKDPFNEMNGFENDPFAGEDPFKADPFKSGSVTSATEDPFNGSDPFQGTFVAPTIAAADVKADPFGASDPFGSFPASSKPANDPFDPFGLSSNATKVSPVTESANADPFGADPFGPQPVAPPRPTSPTPALPPKKSKAPPPRPAPPKIGSSSSKPAPTRAAPAPPVPPAPDPFKLAEAEAAKSSPGFSDLFSDTVGKQDPFDPFGSASGTADNFANFDNFADFDSVK